MTPSLFTHDPKGNTHRDERFPNTISGKTKSASDKKFNLPVAAPCCSSSVNSDSNSFKFSSSRSESVAQTQGGQSRSQDFAENVYVPIQLDKSAEVIKVELITEHGQEPGQDQGQEVGQTDDVTDDEDNVTSQEKGGKDVNVAEHLQRKVDEETGKVSHSK